MTESVLLGPLALFAAATTLTPGPNVVMVTAAAANFGFRRALPAALGVTLGFGAMIVVSGLGLAGLVQAEPRLHAVLRYAGAAYLLHLAWRIAQAGGGAAIEARARPFTLVEAALFTWVNPKAWVMALGALAAYTTTTGDKAVEIAVITAILSAFCLGSLLLWGGFGAAIGRFLGHPHVRAVFNRTMAALLVLSLLPVLW
jgi:threonine/homoserine/homoserine lactone efflux protein